MTSTLPSLSLLDYTNGSPATRIRFLLELEQALREIGFVRFRDHGIPPRLLKEFYDLLRVYFVEWNEDMRMRYEKLSIGRQRGHGPFGCEHAVGRHPLKEFDAKQFFSTGVPLNPGHPRFHTIPVNTYPAITNFRRVSDEMYRNMIRVMNIIFAAVSEIIGMGPQWLPELCAGGDNLQRGLYYPGADRMPQVARDRARFLRRNWTYNQSTREEEAELLSMLEAGIIPTGTQRAHMHADLGIGTALPRASTKGLVAVSRSGEEIAIEGTEEEVLYQNGDTAELLTGGYLRSAPHCVRVHPDVDPAEDRIGVALFGHVRDDAWIDIVPPMEAHATMPMDPATEQRYLALRLREIGHTDMPLPER